MSDLLKMSLALKNKFLADRVQSAVIKTAQEQAGAEGAIGAFANTVLEDKTRQWPDFIIDVASNSNIQKQLVLNDDNTGVVATLVTDNLIMSTVNGTFIVAAKKYAPDTTPAD